MRRVLFLAILLAVFVLPARSEALCTNTAPDTPKYIPGPCHESIGGNSGCIGRCAAGPMRFTPDPIEACEDEVALVNVRVEGGRMDTFGDSIENKGGNVDWGDGQQTPLNECAGSVCNWDLKHAYRQAKTYHPSATFGTQYTNANNPKGGCSYRCRLQAASVANIHVKTAPECTGGKLKKPTTKKK